MALLAAAQAVRTAVVAKYAATEPGKAEALWPSHPAVALNQALSAIAAAAARGEPPPPQAVDDAIAVSARAPLAAGPFLVRGAQARETGDMATAERTLREARRRDPRDRAARYLLAEHYLAGGQIFEGLTELTVLERIAPGGDISPFIASFARTPGAVPQLRRLFEGDPAFEARVLGQLSSDVRNADLIEAIASPGAMAGAHGRQWLTNLLAALVNAGEYGRAYGLWQRASGESGGRLIFDPQFSGSTAPPPFNWTLVSTPAGLAEPDQNGGLRIIYYGRENANLASQLLLLEAGAYSLSSRTVGPRNAPQLLSWQLTCLPGNQTVFRQPIDSSSEDPGRVNFRVEGGDCRAQRLDLVGTAPEFPQQVDLTITDLQLARAGQ